MSLRYAWKKSTGAADDDDDDSDTDIIAGLIPCTSINEVKLLDHRVVNEERTMEAAVSE